MERESHFMPSLAFQSEDLTISNLWRTIFQGSRGTPLEQAFSEVRSRLETSDAATDNTAAAEAVQSAQAQQHCREFDQSLGTDLAAFDEGLESLSADQQSLVKLAMIGPLATMNQKILQQSIDLQRMAEVTSQHVRSQMRPVCAEDFWSSQDLGGEASREAELTSGVTWV